MASLKLTPEAKAHYSQENELKKLLIRRAIYKKAYEEQQKGIDEFTTQFYNTMNTPVKITNTKSNIRIKTLRDLASQYYYEDLFSRFKFTSNPRYNFKIMDEIKYYNII